MRKCLDHDPHAMDRELGFTHIRIQGRRSPTHCQVYINGREWLACSAPSCWDRLPARRQLAAGASTISRPPPSCATTFADRARRRSRRTCFAPPAQPHPPGGGRAPGMAVTTGRWKTRPRSLLDVMFMLCPTLSLEDLARPRPSRRCLEHVLGQCAGILGPQARPSWAAEVVTTNTNREPEGWAVLSPGRPKLGEGVRQSVRLARRDGTIRIPREFRILRVVAPTTPARASGGGVPCVTVSVTCGAHSSGRHRRATAALPPGPAGPAPLHGEGVAGTPRLVPTPHPTRTHRRPASARSASAPTSPCSKRPWPASTPSAGSATPTSLCISTVDQPLTATKSIAHAESVSCLIRELRGRRPVAKVPASRLHRVHPHGYRAH